MTLLLRLSAIPAKAKSGDTQVGGFTALYNFSPGESGICPLWHVFLCSHTCMHTHTYTYN